MKAFRPGFPWQGSSLLLGLLLWGLLLSPTASPHLATQLQARRIFVLDSQCKLARKSVGDRDPDFVLFADHETARHVAGYFNLRDVFSASVIDIGEDQQDQVISDQPPFDARRAPGEDQRQNPEREKNEKAASENHMDKQPQSAQRAQRELMTSLCSL